MYKTRKERDQCSQGDIKIENVMARGGTAQQLKEDKGRKIHFWKEAMEGWQLQREAGVWRWKERRSKVLTSLFIRI